MRGLVFTLIGQDRPGIIDSVAACIAHHGGSWEESQLVRLQGQFAGIVHVEVPDEKLEAVRGALSDLPGLRVTIADAEEAEAPHGSVELDLVGADRPGIIHQIGHVLAESGISMEQLVTSTERAPMSGEAIFRAHAVLAVPPGKSIAALRDSLESLANELMVELELEEQSQGGPKA
jgi:glycine cleavage system regulatory protein